MRLMRNTTDIPDGRVKELLRLAAKGVDHRHVRVEVLNTRFGNSHYFGPGFPKGRIWLPTDGAEWLYNWFRGKWCRYKAWIKIYVPTEKSWAIGKRTGLYSQSGLQSREEALVWVAAHEFYHLRQKRLNDRRSPSKRKKRVYHQKPANEWADKRLEAFAS